MSSEPIARGVNYRSPIKTNTYVIKISKLGNYYRKSHIFVVDFSCITPHIPNQLNNLYNYSRSTRITTCMNNKRTECEPSQFCVCFVRVLEMCYVSCRLK